VTASLRTISSFLRWYANGVWAWVTLKSGSRPRRALQRFAGFVLARPQLAWPASRLSRCLPHPIKGRLRPLFLGTPAATTSLFAPPILRDATDLSPRARELYAILKAAVEKQREAA
jgi:hypothetical protein